MTITSRNIFTTAGIALTLIAVMVCSLVYLSDSADDAERSTADLIRARDLARHINSVRPTSMNSDSVELAAQIPRLLDSTMKSAEIDPENLDRISPQPPRRSDQGGMTEVPLQLNFRQISLRQLLAFVTSLTDENRWLTVRDLHLAYPSTGTAWNVEVTISYLTKSADIGTALAD